MAITGTMHERGNSTINDAGADGSPLHQFTSYDSDGTKLRVYAPTNNPPLMFEYTKQ